MATSKKTRTSQRQGSAASQSLVPDMSGSASARGRSRREESPSVGELEQEENASRGVRGSTFEDEPQVRPQRIVPTHSAGELETTGQELALMAARQAKKRRGPLLVALAAGLVLSGAAVVVFDDEGKALPPPEVAPAASEVASSAPPVTRKEKRELSRMLTGASAPQPARQAQKASAEELPPTPMIELGTGRMRSMEPEELARSIARDKGGAIQLCYERELKKNPRLKGRVVVALELSAPQTVSRVSVKDTLRRPAFTTCVQRSMRKIFFPSLKEDLSIEIPFDLKSPGL